MFDDETSPGSLFGLAPSGVFPATPVAKRAVRSYRTISPLPSDSARLNTIFTEAAQMLFRIYLVLNVQNH